MACRVQTRTLAEELHRVLAQVAIHRAEVLVDLVGDGYRPAENLAPQTIWAVRSTRAVTCSTLSGRGPTATRPWFAINAAARPSNALTALVPTSGVPDAAYSAQRISPPQ